MYYFSKGTLKIANKQFSAVKNDYEMTFNNETSVLPCEDGHHLPTVQFDFTGISDLESKSKDSLVGPFRFEDSGDCVSSVVHNYHTCHASLGYVLRGALICAVTACSVFQT